MILWINGAFGSGKTQTAAELNRRIPHSFVFDPEETGSYIKQNIPHDLYKDDFQDYLPWREINYSMLSYLYSEFSGTIIVPMTITDPQYYKQITERLKSGGAVIQHFTLCASPETLLKRLESRGDGKDSWAAQQIDRCLSRLRHEMFQYHLDTEWLTVDEVADIIMNRVKDFTV